MQWWHDSRLYRYLHGPITLEGHALWSDVARIWRRACYKFVCYTLFFGLANNTKTKPWKFLVCGKTVTKRLSTAFTVRFKAPKREKHCKFWQNAAGETFGDAYAAEATQSSRRQSIYCSTLFYMTQTHAITWQYNGKDTGRSIDLNLSKGKRAIVDKIDKCTPAVEIRRKQTLYRHAFWANFRLQEDCCANLEQTHYQGDNWSNDTERKITRRRN